MKQVKATMVLPKELLEEIQQYIQGENIYIPKREQYYKKWGECSGTRKFIDYRNNSINNAFKNGHSIQNLAKEYYLSVETIKKIVYSK